MVHHHMALEVVPVNGALGPGASGGGGPTSLLGRRARLVLPVGDAGGGGRGSPAGLVQVVVGRLEILPADKKLF